MIRHAIPTTLLVDTTNVCNARCPFCPLFVGSSPIDRDLSPATIMTTEVYSKIMHEVAGWPVRPSDIVHSPNGECLQDPKIVDRLTLLKELDLASRTTLLTNGQFLSSEKANAILRTGVGKLCVGFDGATKEVYEAHRVRCDYDRVLGNILGFVAARAELRAATRLEIKFVRTPQNAHEAVAALAMFRELIPGAGIFNDSLAVDWADEAEGSKVYSIGKASDLPQRPGGCSYFSNDMMIRSDGKIAACCWDYNLTVAGNSLGDVGSSHLLGIWCSDARHKLGQRIDGPLPPSKCQSCLMRHEIPQRPPLISNPVSYGPTSWIYNI